MVRLFEGGVGDGEGAREHVGAEGGHLRQRVAGREGAEPGDRLRVDPHLPERGESGSVRRSAAAFIPVSRACPEASVAIAGRREERRTAQASCTAVVTTAAYSVFARSGSPWTGRSERRFGAPNAGYEVSEEIHVDDLALQVVRRGGIDSDDEGAARRGAALPGL